jgi:hypothetical protein
MGLFSRGKGSSLLRLRMLWCWRIWMSTLRRTIIGRSRPSSTIIRSGFGFSFLGSVRHWTPTSPKWYSNSLASLPSTWVLKGKYHLFETCSKYQKCPNKVNQQYMKRRQYNFMQSAFKNWIKRKINYDKQQLKIQLLTSI